MNHDFSIRQGNLSHKEPKKLVWAFSDKPVKILNGAPRKYDLGGKTVAEATA